LAQPLRTLMIILWSIAPDIMFGNFRYWYCFLSL